jgi:hypothetical protein
MPMLTTSVIRCPVKPRQEPSRTAATNRPIRSSTPSTSGITSLPSTRIGRPERLRSATCSTARCSVWLIFAPSNIIARQFSTSA